MKLRVRIQRQTERLELQGGEEASLTELLVHVQELLLPKHGWSADTEFYLSLNGKEPLSDTGQTLSSVGIVSGDLICVMLPQSGAPAPAQEPSTQGPSTQEPSTQGPSTQGPSTQRPSTQRPSTQEPFTQGPYTQGPSTQEPYTHGPYTQEPMLCSEAEDGQVPLSLELLHRAACGGASGGPCDAIMVAVHLLMLETGFMPQDGELRSGDMPGGWRSAGGAYKLQYTHPLCADSGVMVIGLAMGPLLALNATLNVNQKVDAVRKVCLNPSSYVANEGTGERSEVERTAAAVFRDLAKLSRTVKDQIAYPLIAAARAGEQQQHTG
ncbi:hypothetical protein CRUP_021337 [Coryphaenoides rupestris]|nr:hypothetical protein CRUP_021337 [Coryphaenoides rupestris]